MLLTVTHDLRMDDYLKSDYLSDFESCKTGFSYWGECQFHISALRNIRNPSFAG